MMPLVPSVLDLCRLMVYNQKEEIMTFLGNGYDGGDGGGVG